MGLIDIVYPKRCLQCKQKEAYICSSCISKLKFVNFICPVCERVSVDGMVHAKCRKPWSLDGLISLWPYKGVVRKSILALKYKFAREVAKELASCIQKELVKRCAFLPRTSLLTIIPLHSRRKNWRGFNQMDEVGSILAVSMRWSYFPETLIRKKLHKPQTELKRGERRKNIRGVFGLGPSFLSESLDRNVILFDDVWTTGSTLKEATIVLKRGGVKKIWGLTIAR